MAIQTNVYNKYVIVKQHVDKEPLVTDEKDRVYYMRMSLEEAEQLRDQLDYRINELKNKEEG